MFYVGLYVWPLVELPLFTCKKFKCFCHWFIFAAREMQLCYKRFTNGLMRRPKAITNLMLIKNICNLSCLIFGFLMNVGNGLRFVVCPSFCSRPTKNKFHNCEQLLYKLLPCVTAGWVIHSTQEDCFHLK